MPRIKNLYLSSHFTCLAFALKLINITELINLYKYLLYYFLYIGQKIEQDWTLQYQFHTYVGANLVITVPADDVAPNGDKLLADTALNQI